MHFVRAMAFTRDSWVEKARNRLSGALKEYARQRLREIAPSVTHDWGPEIRRLLLKVEELFDPKVAETKESFDRSKAFVEALTEAGGDQYKVSKARNEYCRDYLDRPQIDAFERAYQKAISAGSLNSEELVMDMLRDFSPRLLREAQAGAS